MFNNFEYECQILQEIEVCITIFKTTIACLQFVQYISRTQDESEDTGLQS